MSPNFSKRRGWPAEHFSWPVTALLTALALAWGSITCPAHAADPPVPVFLPADLALVPPDAMGFVHVRVADLLQSEIGQAVRKYAPPKLLEELDRHPIWPGVSLTDVDRMTFVAVPRQTALERLDFRTPDNEPGLAVVVSTKKPYERAKLLAAALGELREEKYRGRTIYTSTTESAKGAIYPLSDRVFVLADYAELLRPVVRQAVRPRREGPLSPALTAAAGQNKNLLVASVNPSVLASLMFDGRLWPREVMGWWAVYRLVEAESVTLALNAADNKVQLTLDLDFGGNEFTSRRAMPAARSALGLLQDALADLVDNAAEDRHAAPLAGVLGHLENAFADARLERRGSVIQLAVTVAASPEQLKAMLTEGAVGAIQSRDRLQSANNLKDIGLAMHNLLDVNRRFVTAITDKEGKPLLSWRVAILPYIEEVELYRQFKLDEPWDSPHNKKLLEKMPKVYAPIGVKTKEPYATFYQGFAGPDTIFGSAMGTMIDQIVDGMSNTFMVVEAGEPVPWSKPTDLAYHPKKPLPKLGGLFSDGFHALFCDGHAQFIRRGADEEMLRRAITMSDGQIIDLEKLTGRRPPRGAPRRGSSSEIPAGAGKKADTPASDTKPKSEKSPDEFPKR